MAEQGTGDGDAVRIAGSRGIALESGRFFRCPHCGWVGADPVDLAEGYCGACHDVTARPVTAAAESVLLLAYEWLALHRVHSGEVRKVAGVYLDQDRPIPDYLVAVFDQLGWTGWVTVAEGDPLWDLRLLSLTDSGRARYVVLSEAGGWLDVVVPDPQFGTTIETPAGRRSSDPAALGGRSGLSS